MWWKLSIIITCGTAAGALIPEFVKVFTSTESRHTREVVTSSREGGASLNILSGLVAGNTVTRNGDKVTKEKVTDVLNYVVEDAKKDFTITRFKGLGEMNAEQLWDTTMNADTRTLLKVKLEDAVAAEVIFTTLMGENVEARRKFIEDNALEVVNLDI